MVRRRQQYEAIPGVNLPVIRSGERMCWKRCQKKWYWEWRKGLVLRSKAFGALDLGAWMHDAFAAWYQEGHKRDGTLVAHFMAAALEAISNAIEDGAPDHIIDKAEELSVLGEAMAEAYEAHYGTDDSVYVLRAEIPLEFTISHPRSGEIVAVHRIKPDLVFQDSNGDVWLMEHKTAASIQTDHLVIDDQARPYGVMAEPSLRKLGIIKTGQQFRGILYNFMRKALPDQRPQNSEGKYLNKNRSVSKTQPPAYFVRKPVTLTRKAKIITLHRVRDETLEITEATFRLRTKDLHPDRLHKTPHKSCAKYCDFFAMCVAEEEGTDVRDMERLMYRRENPYEYKEDSTEVISGFELG